MKFETIIALVAAGCAMPFIWEFIKRNLLKWQGKLATGATIVLDLGLSALVLVVLGEFKPLIWFLGAAIVFVVSRVFYEHVVKKFFPGKGSVG